MAGKRGTAVVIEVATGKVLAAYHLDAAARRVALPGSSIKTFTLLALLEAGKVNGQTALMCKRPLTVGGHKLDCTHPDMKEPFDPATALAYSCNSYFTSVATRLTPAELRNSFLTYGFGSPSGFVTNEIAGSVARAGTQAELQLQAIGEWGVRVTPLELLRGYQKLALLSQKHDAKLELVFCGAGGLDRLRNGKAGAAELGDEGGGQDGNVSGGRRQLAARLVCRLCARGQAGNRAGGVPGKRKRANGCSGSGAGNLRGVCGRPRCWRLARGRPMRRFAVALAALLLLCIGGDAQPQRNSAAKSGGTAGGYPGIVRVRLWYLHPPQDLKLKAEAGQAKFRKCASCAEDMLTSLTLRALYSRIQIEGDKTSMADVHISGMYELITSNAPGLKADFPVDVHANSGRLLVTASMPMDEYIAGVLAGETGNFKSDEALKAMAVTARTYALHFGSRHALDGFDFCDSTHCQNLRMAEVTPRLRKIVESTAGEVLWYDAEPAATYYHANCGGMTEDGHYILGNDEQRSPYLKQHSDTYCVRSGSSQWQQRSQQAGTATRAGRRRCQRSGAIALGSGAASHGERAGGVPDGDGKPEHYRAGTDVSRGRWAQHWMGPPEEQLV